ncbi:MAG: hypothetical protein IKV59_05075 [Lachnospiraceae bacterium]|nr:hypothetical protein [Lachnospiraceae bacterium]
MADILTEQGKRKQLIFGDGELKKATLTYMSSQKGSKVVLPVQFNPTDYSITRKATYNDTTGKLQEPHPRNLQSRGSRLADLKIRLLLDTTTEYPGYVVKSGLQKYINNDKELSGICEDLSMLTKMYPKTHTQSWIIFSWGSMEFEGFVTELSINYKMFNRNGQPVRAELSLSILGEERNILQTLGAKPRESPDRTKYRMLQQKDELWMLADQEYQDPSCWKEIARENGILNPRKVDYTRQLKVPSL